MVVGTTVLLEPGAAAEELVPIGVPVSYPLNVAIVPLLLALPTVKVKLVAATSVEVARFQNIAPEPLLPLERLFKIFQEASGAVGRV